MKFYKQLSLVFYKEQPQELLFQIQLLPCLLNILRHENAQR